MRKDLIKINLLLIVAFVLTGAALIITSLAALYLAAYVGTL